MDLDLSRIEFPLIELTKEAWAENDIVRVLGYMDNTRCLAFVADNRSVLRERGLYERALLGAYVGTRTNFSKWPLPEIYFLFRLADRKKLLECGQPLPGDGPFTVYRGVSGRGATRRIRGISWTGSLEQAAWFAKRFSHLEKPAVFKAIVEKSLVYAYCNNREEQEFLCQIPANLKLTKVWPSKGKK